MEISEQVGMTPEIIQKVWVFLFLSSHCINHCSYKLSIYLSGLRCVSVCLFSVCSFKTKLPSSQQKERRYYTTLLLATLFISVVILCYIMSHSLNC